MNRATFLNFLYKLIFYIEAGWLLIDMIGGYYLNENNGSSLFNSFIRAIVLVIIFTVFILDRNIKGRIVPFFSYTWIFYNSSITVCSFQA